MKKIIIFLFALATIGSVSAQQLGTPTPLQRVLNDLPAIPIAGRNLKFEFGGSAWIAKVNGENALAGTVETVDISGGSILTLKQTHIWAAAAGRAAGGLLGGALGGAIGSIASTWVATPGPEIVLDYNNTGSRATLSMASEARIAEARSAGTRVSGSSATGALSAATGAAGISSASASGQQLGTPTPLQRILNELSAIPIAGTNLKFEFGGSAWIAKVNGENALSGTVETVDINGGSILTLKQTHVWAGAAGRAVGGLVGGALGGAVGSVANMWVATPGPEIVLDYNSAGSRATLSVASEARIAEARAVPTAPVVAASVSPPPVVPASIPPVPVQPGPAPAYPPFTPAQSPQLGSDSWKNKRVYLGGALGMGSATVDGHFYSYNEVYAVPLTVGGFVADFALAQYFSIGTGFLIGIGNGSVIPVFPVLAKLGRIFSQIELSFDLGYTFGVGFTIGGTFGMHVGPGILFAEFVGMPSTSWENDNASAMLLFVGYKTGFVNK